MCRIFDPHIRPDWELLAIRAVLRRHAHIIALWERLLLKHRHCTNYGNWREGGRETTPFRPPKKWLVGVFCPRNDAGLRGRVFGVFRPPRIRLGQNATNSSARDAMALG